MRAKIFLIFIASIFLLLMFVLSGINKVFKFNGTVESLESKLPFLSHKLAIVGIVSVIILELLAPFLIWTYLGLNMLSEQQKNIHVHNLLKKTSMIAVILLILFTIIVTLIYHPLNLSKSYMKNLAFVSNTSLTGGLLVQLACIC